MKKLMSILMMSIIVMGSYPLMAQKKVQQSTPPQAPTTSQVAEQPQKVYGWQKIPNLTDQQKEQITTLHTAHIKQMTILKNQLEEKKAQMNTATSWASYNAANAENLLDEIYNIKLQLAKEKLSFHDAVRNLLNEDQKIFWDKKFNMNQKENKMGQCCNNMQHCNQSCSQHNMMQGCMHQQGNIQNHGEQCYHGRMKK
ncbi:MAG TPA: hypothetical protein PLQ91_04220 [Bacteroidales bacterium]|nr:hypothetical protein [Bacteroidales bacterium]